MEIEEPFLTVLLESMDRQGLDPTQVIKFIGETAVWSEDDN